MKIMNEAKTQILENYDPENGLLIEDRIVVGQRPSLIETVDNPDGSQTSTCYASLDITEDILVFHPYSDEEKVERLRWKRDEECFSIVNRGKLWYDSLSEEQRAELGAWYRAWLDVTVTRAVPVRPAWLK